MTACYHTSAVTCQNCAPKPCRTCGSCPTCGRGAIAYPYAPYPFVPTTWPSYPTTTWGTGDSTNETDTKGVS